MDDEIREVRTCLDAIVTQPEVSNKDLARAMQSFVSHCYIKHIQITTSNAEKVDRIRESIEPIAAWVRPKIEAEAKWKEDRRRVLVHVLCWSIPLLLAWILATFGGGLKQLMKAWLTTL